MLPHCEERGPRQSEPVARLHQRDSDPPSRPRVVIVGGGFAGLEAARTLRGKPVDVVLVDRRNHHLFQPLLYEVATAALSGPDVAEPIRNVLRKQDNATVLMDEVRGLDLQRRQVVLSDRPLAYDYLIVAAGSETHYFGNDHWARYVTPLKSLEDAVKMRRRILGAFERAELEDDPERRRRLMTFVVVGGGPTGVELAGALTEIARHSLTRNFRRIRPEEARVVLVEMKRLLPTFPESLAQWTEKELQDREVEVRYATVQDLDDHGIWIDDERIECETVLWAAGVRPSRLAEQVGVTEKGRVRVEPDLSVPGRPEVFVVGDMMAYCQGGEWLGGVAQVALQSGRHAARSVLSRLRDEEPRPFVYDDKGYLASIGRSAAVGMLGGRPVKGFWTWLLAWVVHIFWLVGFRNRIGVMLGWFWAYVWWRRTARIILTELPHAEPAAKSASAEVTREAAASTPGARQIRVVPGG